MNEENSKILTEKFPKLFKGIFEERKKWANKEVFGPMAFGFECGDGWFTLIHDLAEKLEALINQLPEDQQTHFYAAQVKEKFGGLRFYMRGETDEMSELISKAESLSYTTCEGCSKPSIVLGQGWLVNCCRDCYIDYAEDRRALKRETGEAGAYWDATKKRQERRSKAIERLNAIREKKGLEKRHYW